MFYSLKVDENIKDVDEGKKIQLNVATSDIIPCIDKLNSEIVFSFRELRDLLEINLSKNTFCMNIISTIMFDRSLAKQIIRNNATQQRQFHRFI